MLGVTGFVGSLVVARLRVDLVRVDRVKIGRVSRMTDLGDMGSRLLAEVPIKVYVSEKRVALDFVDAIASQSLLSNAAQVEDEVGGFVRHVGLLRDAEAGLPVDDLTEGGKRISVDIQLN